MTLQWIDEAMSVCRLNGPDGVDLTARYVFFARTDAEYSLVCPTRVAPVNAQKRDDGWRMFRVEGQLDFSLVGILARLSGALAQAGMGLFAVSTYDTDYILVREAMAARAEAALRQAGFTWRNPLERRV